MADDYQMHRTCAYSKNTVTIFSLPASTYIPWVVMLPLWATLFTPRYVLVSVVYSVSVYLMYRFRISIFGIQIRFWVKINGGEVNIRPK